MEGREETLGVLHAGILAAGLAAVAVPIVIHLLLRRRKRPMEWGAMRFVLEAYRKTRRRTNLERWLLLACRCLLVAALGIGLARPLVSGHGGDGTSGGRTVWFVLDDGLIGQTMVDGKTDLARAVARCQEVLATMGPGDRAGVVLASVPARGVVVPPSGNLAGVRSTLEGLMPTDAPSDWAGAIGLAGEGIVNDRSSRAEGQGEDVIVIAQSGRVGTGRVGESLSRLPARVRLVSAEPESNGPVNVAVTGIKALRPVLLTGGEGSEAAQTVTVGLRRFGDGVEKAGSTRVGVKLAGHEGAVSSAVVNWAAGQREGSATVVVDAPRAGGTPATPISGAAQQGAVVIAEIDGAGDAVAGDNVWRLPVVSREALRVGVLADASARGSMVSGGTADRFRPGQWVSFALRPSDSAAVDLVEIEPGAIDAARLAGLDAVIVLSPEAVPAGTGAASGWSRLKAFADQGGLLVVTPAFEATTQAWPEAMAGGLGVSLTIGRAPKEYPADAPGRLSGAAPAELGAADVLATLRGELEVLARPVAISKLLAPLEASASGSETRDDTKVLVRTQDGAAFITLVTRRGEGAARGGAVMYISAALDLRWTDLPAKPLMVPLMQELVRQGVGRARPVFVSVTGARATVPAGTASIQSVEKKEGPADGGSLAVEPSGRTAEAVRTAGAWRAVDAQGADRGVVAVNASGDADTAPLSKERMASWLASALPEKGDAERAPEVEWAGEAAWSKGLSAAGGDAESRVGAGSMALIAALALAFVEVVLARMASASAVRIKGVARG